MITLRKPSHSDRVWFHEFGNVKSLHIYDRDPLFIFESMKLYHTIPHKWVDMRDYRMRVMSGEVSIFAQRVAWR